ncbi:MiaB/RimO family radical SAM methylthiotransferase [Novosphingobium cyanobacteriorum]|uniref:MiaB/RimO family radical SAM methylthiotransferase n=1 Tax=Novosphingobium cyanobacteriorum TaxID=3024215 RepID=A0ABT6CLP2_9SPHN|nr:MiaB/RimO family radical SAM methylthiotransferase [Novosphingobium cyanobacteriorum]MDF8334844.1 MiaB/RimO family radical SAM methylthiotransferase [Novosphingobium cyanobacteriorum]
MRTILPEVVTLGCRLNLAESEVIRAMLAEAERPTVVVNSCAVTAEAVRQSRRAVRRLRRDHPDARLLVTGCAATIEAESFAAMPEVDGVVANAGKLLPASWGGSAAMLQSSQIHTRAFVPVQTGCDHACTFCVIPQGRGRSVSTPVADVLATVERHLALGVREVVLTGVDVTGWGADLPDTPKLGVLVDAILRAFPALPRLRLSSLDGVEIDDALFELITGEDRVMPHVHLSLQSGSDMVLKRMKRRHSRADAIALVHLLKAARPGIAVGADLIAGFPTEDEGMHADNLSIVRECAVVHGHVFPYSPRPGTPAARMPQVSPPLVRERAGEVRATVAAERARWLQTRLGKPAQVLAERDGTGHAPDFAPYRLPEGVAPGDLVTITPTRIIEGMLA